MDFWKTDDVVAPGKPSEVVVFPFSGGLRKTEIQEAPSQIPGDRHIEDHLQEKGHTSSYPAGLAVFQAVEEHRASNATAGEQDELFQGVHHLHFSTMVKGWIDPILQVESQATQRTWVPLASM